MTEPATGPARGLGAISDSRLRLLVLGGFFVLLLLKGIAAFRLDLFGDEAFYFMCSKRLDWAFVDHPFMTALLVRCGTDLVGDSTFGVRFAFLLLGALYPWIVFWLADPLVGRRNAWWAAGATLLLPFCAHLGVVALPDVPLLVLATAALLCFERACRLGPTRFWLATGLIGALGLATHYRFVLVPFALGLFLLCTREGRHKLREAGPWLAVSTMLPGLLPVLLYNLRLDFAPMRYQGMERHDGGFDPEALLEHLPMQMGVVTPLLYVALIGALIGLLRRARRGDQAAGLCATFALVHLGLFFLTSPIADTEHANVHWPAPGYVPLLIFLAPTLSGFVSRRNSRLRRRLTLAVPISAALVLLLMFMELSIQPFGIQSLHRPFAGWTEVAAETERLLDADPERYRDGESGRDLVVADNYMLAGNLAQKLGGRIDLYVLDHRKNAEHGRALQFPLWDRGEEALRRLTGRTALVVVQRNKSRSRHWDDWREHVGSFFARLEPLDPLVAAGGKDGGLQTFFLYRGEQILDPEQ